MPLVVLDPGFPRRGANVRTAKRTVVKVKPTFTCIGCFGSNCSVFYLYRTTLCYAHMRACKGYGLCAVKSVPCTNSNGLTYYLAISPRKLHQNELKCTEKGRASLHPLKYTNDWVFVAKYAAAIIFKMASLKMYENF